MLCFDPCGSLSSLRVQNLIPTLSIRVWVLSTDKCKQLVTIGVIFMGYKFRTDLHIEYPFFVEMSRKLNGVKRRDNFNGKETFRCVCPRCGKHKAVMGYARSGDTFILACPVDGCDLGGMTLHDLIKRYGGESMFNRWRKARWKTTYTEDWLPIKYRKGD